MLREPSVIKAATLELIAATSDFELVDFVRKHLAKEYEGVFRLEASEDAKVRKYSWHGAAQYDIRTYTLLLLKGVLTRRLNVDVYWHDSVANIKVVLFYEHVLTRLPASSTSVTGSARLIEERMAFYLLYKNLLSRGAFKPRHHLRALTSLDIGTLDPNSIADSRALRSIFASKCFDVYLLPFLTDYTAML